MARSKSAASYEVFFDKNTPIDYEIALFLKAKLNKNDSIFIWGNNAQVYVLSHTLPPGKYTVAYHMLSSEETIRQTGQVLNKTKPKYIIVMPDVPPIPFSLVGYNQKLMLEKITVYEKYF